MAKKKVEEEVIEDKEEEVEAELNYKEDIEGKSIRDIATDDDPKKEEENADEEPKQDDKLEEDKEEPEKEEEKVEDPKLDPEKLKQEISDETTAKIVKALTGGDDKQTEENLNAYEKYARDVWDKEKRQPRWDEVLPLIEEAAVQRIQAKQDAMIQKEQDDKQAAEEARDAELERFNKGVDEELDELYRTSKLPKIKNQDDENDFGMVARKALFKRMAEVNMERVEQGLPPITSISRIYASYYKLPNRQPAGADAPIGDGRGSVTSANEDEEIDYFRDVKGGFRKIYNSVLKK